MKIKKLITENVKRISVVEVSPDGSLITIGGKNGAGKSSVLDSIAYALGGEKLVPSQPIRKDQAEARITVDIEDYIVTRRFYRDVVHVAGCASAPEIQIKDNKETGKILTAPCNCKTTFGPTKSVLTVTNRDGAKYPSPQVLLDKLYGKLTFDPLAFSKEKPPQQNETLRRLVNLDFGLLNGQRKTAFDARAMHKKTLAIQQSRLEGMHRFPDAPAIEVPIEEISTEIKRGHELQTAAEDAIKSVADAESKCQGFLTERETRQGRVDMHREEIKRIELRIKEEEALIKGVVTQLQEQTENLSALRVTMHAAKEAVPNFEELDVRLREIDATNRQVRDNQAYQKQQDEVKRAEVLVDEADGTIRRIDEEKSAALINAKFPVEGLGLTDDGVTFEGLPLEEVSSSVQLRVSIAIGLALNATLKVLLIRNGNLLDEDGLKVVAEQAEAAGAQVWMEYVTSSKDGVSVMLEDGHVAS